MRRSPLNPKPIKLSHCEACVFLGNALREYLKTKPEMKKQKKMDPAQRRAYQDLLNQLGDIGEEADSTRQILQLALQLDEKGEFYKFIEIFGNGDESN